MAKMLYGWDDGKFKEEYLKKLERNWRRNLKREVISSLQIVDLVFLYFIFHFHFVLFSYFSIFRT